MLESTVRINGTAEDQLVLYPLELATFGTMYHSAKDIAEHCCRLLTSPVEGRKYLADGVTIYADPTNPHVVRDRTVLEALLEHSPHLHLSRSMGIIYSGTGSVKVLEEIREEAIAMLSEHSDSPNFFGKRPLAKSL